ncbi:phage baseplate protein [Paenibacillus agricola]|uniref:Dit-like phage tail protein N-terminal domain-containing protein n=1 Tax=Paenibacillus agricola TaxID=2716264 RepID=A0ABX0J1Y8_9BACL|nr:hypothetical protein [Paenibacillus agricola]NHN29446.1 hypothetical protein [Paenibacillus agricola]
MATINGNYVTVESEEPSHDIDVTEQPIEDGIDLLDHVRPKAKTMNISGFIVGEDAAQIRQNILNLLQSGSIIEYIGRNQFVGILTGFRSTHNHQISNGLSFSATLKEVLVAKTSTIEQLPLPIRAAEQPVLVLGRKQTAAKGTSSSSSSAGKESVWD